MNRDDIQANIHVFVTTRTAMPALTSQPAPCSIRKLSYIEDSGIYFECARSLETLVWLDSNDAFGAKDDISRFDILTAEPIAQLISPTVNELKAQMAKLKNGVLIDPEADKLPFIGGIIGSVKYEDRHETFNLDNNGNCQPSCWGVFDWALIQDHVDKSCVLVNLPTCSERRVEKYLTCFENAELITGPTTYDFSSTPFVADTSRREYDKAFEAIQRYIVAGDCYQINYAQRFSAKFHGDSRDAYTCLRKKLPSHYSAYLELHEQKILSFSPEQFVAIQGRLAQTKPIKGTIKRSANATEDQELSKTLKHSEKNQAENIMIVDLLRNDFSVSCEPFSVKTKALLELESYANVHHLTSTVVGTLDNQTHPIDFFMRCFPGGSITGAPKKRAMEIIDELEQYPRGTYCGSVVYYSVNDRIDSNIAIRTIHIDGDNIYCWGGGGIVADSTADDEYSESIQKVKILMDTLECGNTPA